MSEAFRYGGDVPALRYKIRGVAVSEPMKNGFRQVRFRYTACNIIENRNKKTTNLALNKRPSWPFIIDLKFL